jgi:very-short-patch-repair endonuclease
MKQPVFRDRNTERSRELRITASPAERAVWAFVSGGQVDGYRFTRQYQIGPYFADLLCRSKRLIIEIDGISHDTHHVYDERRTEYLRAQGYQVLRFTNEDVMTNVEGVVMLIAKTLAGMPSPSPSREREGNK